MLRSNYVAIFLVFSTGLAGCMDFTNEPIVRVLLTPDKTMTQANVSAGGEMTLSALLETDQVVQYRIWSLGELAGIEASLRGPKGLIWKGSSLGTELRIDAVRIANSGKHELILNWIQGSGVANYRYSVLSEGPSPLVSKTQIEMQQARIGHQAVAISGSEVLIMGGSNGNDPTPTASTEIVNTEDGSSSLSNSMEESRTHHSATRIEDGPAGRIGDVFVAGGIGPQGDALLTTEIFDHETGTFEGGPLMNEQRAFIQALYVPGVSGSESFLNGKIVMVGGERTLNRAQFEATGQQYKYIEVDENSPELYYYDPASDLIQSLPSMAQGRLFPSVSYLPNGWLVIMGGGIDSTPSAPGCDVDDESIHCYCKSQGFHLCTQYLGEDGKEGFINYTFKDRATNTVEIYDTNTANLFQLNSKMHRARLGHSAAVLPGGRVLVAGGSTAARRSFKENERHLAEFPRAVDSVELFDPNLNDSSGNPGVFYLLAPLAFPREQHQTAVTKSGKAIVMGGFHEVPGGLSPIEAIGIYPGSKGSVAEVDVMTHARGAMAATLMFDRLSVLVTGGIGVDGPLDSAELLTFTE